MMSRGRRRFGGENGWEGFGGYMNAKIQKLDKQFDVDNLNDSQSTGIFSGVSIFVNGHTEPSADKLKALMQKHGGRFIHYYNRSTVTHIIVQNLPTSKQRQLREEKVVSPRWILESVEAGVLQPWEKYQLYPIRERHQKGLDNFLKDQRTSVPDEEEETKKDSEEEEEEEEGEASGSKTTASSPMLKAGDPGFISEFYARSRLHHIATWGAEFKDYANVLRAECDNRFPLRQALKEVAATAADEEAMEEVGKLRVVMHVDMDCFFVSVGLRDKPELKGKPVAVAHAKGGASRESGKPTAKSYSEIASCSYEARRLGLKNGMFLGKAQELCPDLITIPYEFEGYKSVARLLYDTVAEYTVDLEAVSCDELFVDCTALLREVHRSPMSFADHLRSEISRRTKCTASCGFGANPLLARLATKRAKPDGQFWIRSADTEEMMGAQPVGDLPGVGPSLKRRLADLGCEKCEELQRLPLPKLQRQFGAKMGLNLFQLCRGIDDTPVHTSHERKSISAEINYGIRFQSRADMDTFVKELAEELSQRMKRARVKGRTIGLKMMLRRSDQPQETRKFMGHGICDNLSKSVTLPLATDDGRLIAQETLSLLRTMSVVAEDVRGMGIQMHRLDEQKGKRNMSLFEFTKKTSMKDQDTAPNLPRHLESTPKVDRVSIRESKSKPRPVASPIRMADHGTNASSAIPVDDLPNYSQVDSSFLAAMPAEIRQELDSVFERKRRGREKPQSPSKVRPGSPSKSPPKRGRGRGRAAPKGQLTLTSMLTGGKQKLHPRMVEEKLEARAVAPSPEAPANDPSEEPSLFGARTAEEVRVILKEWVEAEPEPQSKDVDYFQSFLLSCLPRNLELLCQSLSFFANLCVDNAWLGTYEQLETVIQSEMVITYGGPLKPAVIRRFVEFDDL